MSNQQNGPKMHNLAFLTYLPTWFHLRKEGPPAKADLASASGKTEPSTGAGGFFHTVCKVGLGAWQEVRP